jgi:hypothetical protein
MFTNFCGKEKISLNGPKIYLNHVLYSKRFGELKILGSISIFFGPLELILITLLYGCVIISLGPHFLIYCPKYVTLLAFFYKFCCLQMKRKNRKY